MVKRITKIMAKTSPTQRSLRYLRDNGYTAQVVEKYVSFIHKRIDLFGCIDIVAIREDVPGVLGVQTTSASNLSSHIKKIESIPEVKTWLASGNRLVLHGWGLKGANGKRKIYKLREIDYSKYTLEQELEKLNDKQKRAN